MRACSAEIYEAKERNIELEGKLEEAKYEGSIWAREETVKLHPKARNFFRWMESNEDEMIVDIDGDQ